MKHPIGITRNGISVYVDLIQSRAAKQIAQQPYLVGLVCEALQQLDFSDPEVRVERDMGRNVGYSFIVDTTDSDTIIYAKIQRDDVYTRFVKSGKPHPTQYLSMVLARDEGDGDYGLCDTWVGRLAPPRPGSANETAESKAYWATKACVLGSQPLKHSTVTKVCPWL
jgi:hypothetical protein